MKISVQNSYTNEMLKKKKKKNALNEKCVNFITYRYFIILLCLFSAKLYF